MGAMKEHPRCNIVSVRISDLEKEILTKISIMNKSSISEVCRDALYMNVFKTAQLGDLASLSETTLDS